jgi:hypothetical protein
MLERMRERYGIDAASRLTADAPALGKCCDGRPQTHRWLRGVRRSNGRESRTRGYQKGVERLDVPVIDILETATDAGRQTLGFGQWVPSTFSARSGSGG